MWYGVAYYPEHWPEERWEIDFSMMKELGFNVVRMAEFAWAKLEPVEGQYDFSWLDRAVAICYNLGIKIILGTPTPTPPIWAIRKFPGILPVDEYGRTREFGSRRHYCTNSSEYYRLTENIVQVMVEQYRNHPAVMGWQIDNEFSCHETTRCYCQNCEREFRDWLRQKYRTIEELNQAWGTVFWSMTFRDFEEIPVPRVAVTERNPSIMLDYYRFCSDADVKYQKFQIDLLKTTASHQLITHNMMGVRIDELNLFDLGKDLDFVSWDNYLVDGQEPVLPTLGHDLTRGIKKGADYWVMEQQIGYVNWSEYNPAIRPGYPRLWIYHALAHGAKGIVFFRWRGCHYAQEQFHSGILKYNAEKSRAYEEISVTLKELSKLEPILNGARVRAKVAMVFSYDNWWALKLQPHNKDFDYLQHFVKYYQTLLAMNVPLDIVQPTEELAGYDLVIAPTLMLLNDQIVNNLSKYVREGGYLVTTLRSGMKTWSNLVNPKSLSGELEELLGGRVEEFDSFSPAMTNTVRFTIPELSLTEYPVHLWAEVLTLTSAETLAEYQHDYYQYYPAVSRNRFGEGQVLNVAMISSDSFYRDLLTLVLKEAGISPLLFTPAKVEVCTLVTENGEEIYVILNHNLTEQVIYLPGEYVDLLQSEKIGSRLVLEPCAVRVLKVVV